MYTKEEWRVISDPLGKFTDIFGEAGMPIATITHYGRDIEQNLANAHLIAKSPQMFELLKRMVEGGWSTAIAMEVKEIIQTLDLS